MRSPLQSIYIYSILIVGLFAISCNRNLDQVSWDTDNALPLAQGTIRMQDLIASDSNITSGGDNVVHIVSREELYTFDNPLDSLVNIEINPFTRSATLDELALGTQTAGDTFYIAEIFQQAGIGGLDDGDSVSSAFFNFFAPVVDLPDQQVDFSAFLQEAVLIEGFMDLVIDNHLPVIINTADLEIRNTSNQEVIFQTSINDLQPYSLYQNTIDLAAELGGRAIEGDLTISITNIELVAPMPPAFFYINTSDYVSFTGTIRDVSVESATAVFPTQNVIDVTDNVVLRGIDDVQLVYALIDSGVVEIEASSTLNTDLFLYFELPGAIKDGQSFSFEAVVPATGGQTIIEYDTTVIFEDYELDLTGVNQDTVNAFTNVLVGRIDSTGEIIELTLDDTLYINLLVSRLKPNYVRGYLGQDTILAGPESLEIDFGELFPEDLPLINLSTQIVIENDLGFGGNLVINELSSSNSNSEEYTSSIGGNSYTINPATDLGAEPDPSTTIIQVDDAERLLDISPNEITYDIALFTNPSGNTGSFGDFLYNSSSLKAFADIDLPLRFSDSASITFRDTADFDLDVEINEDITNAAFRLATENGFPIDLYPTLYFLDSLGNRIDSLVSQEFVQAGIQDQNGNIVETVRSEVVFLANERQLDNVFRASRVIIVARAEMYNNGNDVVIYDSNFLKFSLYATFNVNINTQF